MQENNLESNQCCRCKGNFPQGLKYSGNKYFIWSHTFDYQKKENLRQLMMILNKLYLVYIVICKWSLLKLITLNGWSHEALFVYWNSLHSEREIRRIFFLSLYLFFKQFNSSVNTISHTRLIASRSRCYNLDLTSWLEEAGTPPSIMGRGGGLIF